MKKRIWSLIEQCKKLQNFDEYTICTDLQNTDNARQKITYIRGRVFWPLKNSSTILNDLVKVILTAAKEESARHFWRWNEKRLDENSKRHMYDRSLSEDWGPVGKGLTTSNAYLTWRFCRPWLEKNLKHCNHGPLQWNYLP